MSKAIATKISALIEPAIAAAGYELVRVKLAGAGKYAALQIMAERQDGAGMKVEDCAAISKAVSPLFEADPEFADKYDLEVSSPGIDRPLMKPQDYARFQGHVAKVELGVPLDGQKRFQGKILRVADKEVALALEEKEVSIPFEAIDKAKLVLTDELLKAAASGKVTH